MDRQGSGDSAGRFADYLDKLASVMGHAGRVGPMRDYCTGLLLPCERKSVEPIAAATAPERVGAQHQALLHFMAEGMWSDEVVLAKVRDMLLPQIERHGPIEAWILDDTGFPKHGAHSVGVTHQYCGELGKQANCQAAVSLSIANHHASLPVAYRLYLPKSWAQDKKRRRKAGVPDEIAFQTKPKIALDQLARACAADLPRGVVHAQRARGMAAGRVAKGRAGTNQILALFVAQEHRLRPLRRHHHDALAYRARLPRPQAGGRARPLRRARLARISPPRHHVHRSLRLPDLREGRHFPLGRALRNSPPATCPSPGLQTQRRRRCGLSGTLPTPSPACDAASSPASHEHCHDVPAVPRHEPARNDAEIRDAVRLIQLIVTTPS